MSNPSASARKKVLIDGNEAAAYVEHQINEVIAIYPITPSSNMGEWADQWSAVMSCVERLEKRAPAIQKIGESIEKHKTILRAALVC